MAPNSGACSRMRTRRPARPNASAVVSPPRPPPTMMIGRFAPSTCSPPLRADPFDLPFEFDTRDFANARAHGLAERLDVGRVGAAPVYEEVAMELGDLSGSYGQTAASRGVDELPRFVTGRILERRAAGPALDRLGRFSAFGNFVHLGGDDGLIARAPLEQRLGEDHVVGHAAIAIAVLHFCVAENTRAAGAVNAAAATSTSLVSPP